MPELNNYFQRAAEARERIKPYIYKTPLLFSNLLSEKTGKKVWLKLETQQPTCSFKVRPAFNSILSRLEDARRLGVLATSSGNFAQAVAYASKKLGAHATIVMTDDTAPFKVERTRSWGAEIVFCGTTFESRFEALEKLKKERGGVVVHPFDTLETIAGDGTLALELLEDLSKEFSVLCPVSGGGLIGGIATVLKHKSLKYQIYGVQPQSGGAMAKSIEKGQRVNIGKAKTIADALVASIPGENAFKIAQEYVDGFGCYSEEEIKNATLWLINEHKLVVEPGAALSVVGLLSGNFKALHDDVVCVISGGNLPISVNL